MELKQELIQRLVALTGLSEEKCYEYLEKYQFNLNEIFSELIQSDQLSLVKEELDCDLIEDMKPIKKIGVFATMSAGKSTLINSLIGKNLCPSQNQACTARILKFRNNDELEQAMYVSDQESREVKLEDIKELNTVSTESLLEFEVNFKGIQTNEHIIELFDTPGVNYSQDLSHGELSFKFLEEQEFNQIIYLMNATQFGVEDDKALLIELKEKIKTRDIELTFIINKVDEFDLESDGSIQELVESCSAYLEAIGFDNPHIVPISGQGAKILRMGLSGEVMTRKEERDFSLFIEIFNDDFYFLPKYRKNIEYEYIEQARFYGNLTVGTEVYSLLKVRQALEATGILLVEQLLN